MFGSFAYHINFIFIRMYFFIRISRLKMAWLGNMIIVLNIGNLKAAKGFATMPPVKKWDVWSLLARLCTSPSPIAIVGNVVAVVNTAKLAAEYNFGEVGWGGVKLSQQQFLIVLHLIGTLCPHNTEYALNVIPSQYYWWYPLPTDLNTLHSAEHPPQC